MANADPAMCRSGLRLTLAAVAAALVLSGCSGSETKDASRADEAAAAERGVTPTTTGPEGATRDSGAYATDGGIPAGGVVVRSTGPSAGRYQVGTSFSDGSVITLVEGDQLVILNADGTRTLSGPGQFAAVSTTTAASDASARGQTLGRMAGNLGEDEGRSAAAAARMPPRPPDPATGTSGRIDTAARYAAALFDGEGRSAAAATRRTVAPPGMADNLAQLPEGPGLWTFALGSSGTHCLPALNDIVFARRGGGEALSISITPAGGAARSLTLPSGRSSVGWTGSWLTARARYRITIDGGPASEARFVAIGAPPRDSAALARVLAERGCTRQVQRLARMMGASGIARDDIAIPGRLRETGPAATGDATVAQPGGVRSDIGAGVGRPRGGGGRSDPAAGDIRGDGVGGVGPNPRVVPDAPQPIDPVAAPVVRPRVVQPPAPRPQAARPRGDTEGGMKQ